MVVDGLGKLPIAIHAPEESESTSGRDSLGVAV